MIGSAKHKFKLEGWPKLARFVGAFGLVGLLAANTVACSSTSEGEEEEEVVDEEGGNEAAAVANEDTAPAEAGAANEAGLEAEIANINSGATTENIPANDAGVNTAGVDQVANALPVDATAETAESGNSAPVDAAVAEAPALPADAAPAAATTVANAGPGLPAGTNAVVYVGGENAAVYDAPNGREVARLVRGDFVLASAEGEWAKTSDGRFVRSSDLQVKPVGRKIVQSRWRSPRSGN